MKKIFVILVCCNLCLAVNGQTRVQSSSLDSLEVNEKYWAQWLTNLYDMGVIMTKDSIKINEEARRIIMDSNFRKLIYPQEYTWPVATQLLKQMELKKGFWYLINLYRADTANKKMVIETLMPFDSFMDMEKIMGSTFYTYALLDPKICSIKNGKPVITRPDIVEKQFNQVKEIITYIDYYRKQRKSG